MADKNPFMPSGEESNPFMPASSTSANPFMPKSHAATVHAAPARPAYETKKNARPNPLRETGEVLGLPVSLLGAAWESVPALNSSTHPRDNYLARAIDILRRGHGLQDFYNNAAAVNEEFDPFSSATMKRAGLDPKAHPVLRGVGELGAQWYSPGNAAMGRTAELGLGLLGRGVRSARAASPVLDDAIKPFEQIGGDIARPIQRATAAARRAAAKAAVGVASKLPGTFGAGIRGLVDRYYAAGLPQRGGAPYVQAAFAAQAAPEHAAAQATNSLRKQFDGLTLAQKREIQKLSYVDENGKRLAQRDPNVPEPQNGPSLEQRAVSIRGTLFDLDRRQESLGIRTRTRTVQPNARNPNPNAAARVVTGDLYDSGTYWPMRQFGEQPVFQSQDLAKAAQSGDELALENAISARAGRGRSKFSASVSKPGHKAERTLPDILNPDVEAELHPEYDPAYQLEQHVAETERAIANEESRRGLESLPNINPETGAQRTTSIPGFGKTPLYARMPLQYQLEANERRPLAMIFGTGEEGRKAMERYIARSASARAAEMAREDPRVVAMAQKSGIDPKMLGSRSVTQVNVAPVRARIAEATNAQRRTGKLAQNVANAATRVQSNAEAELGRAAALHANGAENLRSAIRTGLETTRKSAQAGKQGALAGDAYRAAFEAVDNLPPKLASRIRPLVEAAGEQPTPETIQSILNALKGASGDAADAARASVEKLANASSKGHGPFSRIVRPVERAAERGEKTAAREAASVGKRAERISQPASSAAAKAADVDAKQTKRVESLTNAFAQRAARAETAAAFQKASKEYYSRVFDDIAQSVRNEAPKAPEGYTRESTLGLGSPTGREMALDEPFANFYKGSERLSPREFDQVKKLWNVFQVLNRMARMSVVLIPTVHGINNLGIHFLSEGGDPARMAEILAGRAKFSDELKQRAYAAGAATDWSQSAFGLDSGAHATTAIPERAAMIAQHTGPLAKVAQPVIGAGLHAEKAYNAMNSWLFHDAEQGFAFDLFDKFTKQGMSDGEAAMRVRNALGRYDNISPRELAARLNQVFYFYPWMKTAVAYWARKGVLDPKWWSAPVRAIETNNKAQGYDDPSQPFTATLGKRSDGEFRRYVVPVPQRVTANIAEAARVPLDVVRGDWANAAADAKAPLNYVVGHFNPGLQIGKDLYDAATQGATRVAPWNLFHVTPGEPGAQQNADVAGRLLGKVISPISRAEDVVKDPLGTIGAYLSGGTTYETASAAQQAAQRSIRTHIDAAFHAAIAAAQNRGDMAAAQRLTQMREAAIQRAIENLQKRTATSSPALAPLPVPAASANPFMP